jgi:cysteine desulfurase
MQEKSNQLYLDYAASAPMRGVALDAERDYDAMPFAGANPNSLHAMGRESARLLEADRRVLARVLGGGFRPADVILTSGGTESNNLAVLGLAEGVRGHDRARGRVVLSAIEHDSIIDLVPVLHEAGFEVDLVMPGRDGVVAPEALEALVSDDCALVSVMAANNETGVVQPITDLAKVAHAHGALFHTDAVQGFCRIPLDLSEVDAASVAAHKIGGPVGIGALAVRGRCPLRPRVFGGGQERGLRAGTQDVRATHAFAATTDAVCGQLGRTCELLSRRTDSVYATLCAPSTGIVPTTTADSAGKLPGMVSVMVPGFDSETLILRLDAAGFEVSAGSACSSGSLDPSHVLSAMGIPRDEAFGSLRVSFDERVDQADLDRFATTLVGIVADLSLGGSRR